MAGKLGKFQMQNFKTFGGLGSEKHLASVFGKSQQKLANTMVVLQAAQRGRTLDNQLSQYATKTFESDDEYTWDVVGSVAKNIPLLYALDEDGKMITANPGGSDSSLAMIGAGTAPFYLVFGETYFYDGEVIVGNLNEVYPLRILGDPILEGTNTKYKVETMGGITAGVPKERLLPGEKFSVEYAPIEKELSRKVGDKLRLLVANLMSPVWSIAA